MKMKEAKISMTKTVFLSTKSAFPVVMEGGDGVEKDENGQLS